MKRCFFIGHRRVSEDLLSVLSETVRILIVEQDVGEFIVGHYGQFDDMVCKVVGQIKQAYPHIRLLLLTPYHPTERVVEIPKEVDDTYYPTGMENVPRRLAIVRANRYMIDHSDFLIAYVTHPGSNAKNLLEYARKREKRQLIFVRNLGKD